MAGSVTVSDCEIGRRFFLIAGPCIAESEELCLAVAESASEICQKFDVDYVFKASYDKANRSSVKSERGPGIDKGLAFLASVREQVKIPVLSDIHMPDEALKAAEVLDILQIPAFLCRQTDLLVAAARTGKPVNVKKGQFLAPWDMKNVVDKLKLAGASGIMLTERGTSFGYNNLVTDMRAIPEMQKFGFPVVIDATHCVQLPGGMGESTDGQRQYVETIALAGIAAGADGLFLEIHPEPEKAPCDAKNMLPVSDLEVLLEKVLAVYEAVRGS